MFSPLARPNSPQTREYLFIKKVPTISLLVVWFNVLAQLLCAVSVQQKYYNKSLGSLPSVIFLVRGPPTSCSFAN